MKTRLLALISAFGFLELACGPCGAVTLAQYELALAHFQAAIAADSGSSHPTAAVAVLHKELDPIVSVQVPGVGPAPVDDRFIAKNLARLARHPNPRKAGYAALERQVADLKNSIFLQVRVAGKPPLDVRSIAMARSILSESDYGYDPLPPPTMMDRFWSWVEKMLDKIKFKDPAPSSSRIDPTVPRTLLIILGAAAVALLVYVLVSLLRRYGVPARAVTPDGAEAALIEARDADSLLAMADRYASQGDFRAAFRLVYVASLVSLDTGGVLRFDRSKTNWEYLRALRTAGRDDLYRALTPLTRDFDRVWYGYRQANESEYASAVAQYQALKAAPSPALSR